MIQATRTRRLDRLARRCRTRTPQSVWESSDDSDQAVGPCIREVRESGSATDDNRIIFCWETPEGEGRRQALTLNCARDGLLDCRVR
jgi:hypothetical protein